MKKTVWIFNHYAAPPQYETRVRNNVMAKYLMQAGYNVTIFGASTIHNTDINLITDGSCYVQREYDGLKFVHINVPEYSGNGISRKLNLLAFPFRLWKYTKRLEEKPDIIVNDLDVMTMDFPFMIAKRYRVPIITEVRDLWPESIIEYGLLKRNSLLAKFLYIMERRMYVKSDKIVFSMEGGYDYIVEKGWEKEIPRSKTYYINNGVELETFYYNRDHFKIQDQDLENSELLKIVYVGSIRRVNNLGILLDVAKQVKNPKVKFLIWGDGDELPVLKQRLVDENIENVVFKGRVEKKYIPYIVSQATWNFMHGSSNGLFRFGISPNKMFDYFAAKRPLLMDIDAKYNPVKQFSCGLCVDAECEVITIIQKAIAMPENEYQLLCNNAGEAAKEFDFLVLTKKLIRIIEEL